MYKTQQQIVDKLNEMQECDVIHYTWEKPIKFFIKFNSFNYNLLFLQKKHYDT